MSPEPPVIYGPRPGRRWWWCGGTLLVGALLAVTQWPRPLFSAAGPAPGNPLADLAAAVLLGAGLVLLLAIVRGVPRLTLDGRGLVLRTFLRTTALPWDGLGQFTVRVIGLSGGRQRFTASAPVAGWPAGGLSIPDAFEAPFADIMDAIDARHGGLADGVPPVVRGLPVREAQVGVAGFRWPWMTAVLVVTLIVVFGLEQRFAVAPGGADMSPSMVTLTALGALNRSLLQAGQWYRLLSAPLLHGGTSNLIMDCLTIAIAGYALEAAVGWAWMFCIFVAGALAGTVGSLVLTPPSATPLGTSGAIMAMLVSLFLISLRLSPGRARARIQALAAWAAVPALIPASIAAVAAQLDYGARVGGVVAGAAVGLLLLRTWRAESPLPRFQAGATVVAVLAALAFGGSAVAVARGYPAFLTRPGMVPLAEYPHTAAEVSWSSGRLLATYPRDPMAHVFASQEFWQRKDLAGAEREMRAALALAEASATAFSPDLPNTLRVSLAAVLVARGRTPEARAVAHEPCVATGAAMPPARMAAVLRTYGLCKPPS